MIPPKLQSGDTIRIITPARSLAMPWINKDIQNIAKQRLEQLGLRVTFGKHVLEIDNFNSSSIASRVEDLHDAFRDTSVKMIHTVIGGFNSIELLPFLDYELIKKNPKILCGYSDITALANALHAKTGLVTYSGPHFFDFGEEKGFEFTRSYFQKCFFQSEPIPLESSPVWSEDRWGKDQENRIFQPNPGHMVIQSGKASGYIVGGNLVTLHSLSGTGFMPSLKDKVLFLEEDKEEHLFSFTRNLCSLSLQPDFSTVKAIVFGRFESDSKISIDDLRKVVASNKRLQHVPIVAGVDFGHTTPKITFPIGGHITLDLINTSVKITIDQH